MRYTTSVVDFVVGERSGLPVPVLDIRLAETKWYETPSFIEELASKLPRPMPTFPDDASPKDREKALVAALEKTHDKKVLEHWKVDFKQRLNLFWHVVGQAMEKLGAGADILEKTRERVRHCVRRQRSAEWRKFYGVVRRGKVALEREDCFYPYQSAVMRELPNPVLSFVPPIVQRKIDVNHVERLRRLEDQLVNVMRIRGGYDKDARDSNRGKSFGLTTVQGGTHSNKRKGISGSIHMNKTLTGMSTTKKGACAELGIDVDKLQDEIVEAITDVIVRAFGKAPWFKAALHKFETVPKNRMLPGRQLPSSHIWWTSDPKFYHVHTDTNTVPPAFLVCVSDCKGGELCCLPPTGGPTIVDTSVPTVVGGSWAQYPHCNLPVLRGDRHSFVIYMDHRNLADSYKVMID